MIKIQKIEDVQKAIEDLEKIVPQKKDVAPKRLRHFNDLRFQIQEQLDNGESALATDDTGAEFLVFKKDGKLFKIQSTEVT